MYLEETILKVKLFLLFLFVLQDDLTRMFQLGNSSSFWKLWDQHILKDELEKDETQRLIFSLQLYFAVFPLLEDEVFAFYFLFNSYFILFFFKFKQKHVK